MLLSRLTLRWSNLLQGEDSEKIARDQTYFSLIQRLFTPRSSKHTRLPGHLTVKMMYHTPPGTRQIWKKNVHWSIDIPPISCTISFFHHVRTFHSRRLSPISAAGGFSIGRRYWTGVYPHLAPNAAVMTVEWSQSKMTPCDSWLHSYGNHRPFRSTESRRCGWTRWFSIALWIERRVESFEITMVNICWVKFAQSRLTLPSFSNVQLLSLIFFWLEVGWDFLSFSCPFMLVSLRWLGASLLSTKAGME